MDTRLSPDSKRFGFARHKPAFPTVLAGHIFSVMVALKM
jgi:hypothetical protein